MKQRSPIAVFFLNFIPFYSIYWYVATEREMRALGADIPTAWLIIIPFVSLWWQYKYCQGVEKVSNEKTSAVLAFVLLLLLGSIGQAILQDTFNKVTTGMPMAPAPSPSPMTAPAAPAQPLMPPSDPTLVH